MKNKLFRILAAAVLITVVGSSVFYFKEVAERGEVGEAEYPTELGKYLEKQREAVPGTEEGPGSAAEAAFQARAYPADTPS